MNKMSIKEMFEETGRLGNKIRKEIEIINNLHKECLKMMDICSHDLVFKYINKHPRKIIIDGYYFCPVCGKNIRCIDKEALNKSIFNKSRIIDLTNLSLEGSKDVFSSIRREVYANIDYYYDKEIDEDTLASTMEEILFDKQTTYKSYTMVNSK